MNNLRFAFELYEGKVEDLNPSRYQELSVKIRFDGNMEDIFVVNSKWFQEGKR